MRCMNYAGGGGISFSLHVGRQTLSHPVGRSRDQIEFSSRAAAVDANSVRPKSQRPLPKHRLGVWMQHLGEAVAQYSV